MLTSFYSTNSFARPYAKGAMILKRHITQSEQRPEPSFQQLLKSYRREKMEELTYRMNNSSFFKPKMRKTNVRTLNKILGKDVQ